ncbi:hypothetical protein EBS80_01375 [bacterium]|nr:hypothetical protein [bacterium]
MGKYILGTVAAILLILGISGVTTYNGFARSEAAISAQDRNIDVIGGSAYVKSKLSAQVAGQYGDLVIKAIDAGTKGRYGQTGASAAMLFIQEQNPDIDGSVYKQVQRTVEAAFTDLQAAQTTKQDMIASYEGNLNSAWGGVIAGVGGFPRMDLEKAKQVITTGEMKDARTTGELMTPNLFGNDQK